MYQNIYSIVQQYVFEGAVLTPNMDLIATLISSIAVIFMVALPFTIVWRVIKMIVG